VIRIYDLGEAEGVKFITMEFIEGKDLRSVIREKQKISPEEAVEVIQQVCQGTGRRAQRWRDSPRPQTAKHHAGTPPAESW